MEDKKRDPRVDPDGEDGGALTSSVVAVGEGSRARAAGDKPALTDDDDTPRAPRAIDPRAEPDDEPAEEVRASDESPAGPDSATTPDGAADSPVAKARSVTSIDPRLAPLEELLDRNDWAAVQDQLGPVAELGKLPPNLALLGALAHHERGGEDAPDATPIAIRCVAALLAVDEDSPAARVLAKRLLRKNPVTFRERKAPPARTSALIIIVTLVVGGGVGFLASLGSWRAVLNLLHL